MPYIEWKLRGGGKASIYYDEPTEDDLDDGTAFDSVDFNVEGPDGVPFEGSVARVMARELVKTKVAARTLLSYLLERTIREGDVR